MDDDWMLSDALKTARRDLWEAHAWAESMGKRPEPSSPRPTEDEGQAAEDGPGGQEVQPDSPEGTPTRERDGPPKPMDVEQGESEADDSEAASTGPTQR